MLILGAAAFASARNASSRTVSYCTKYRYKRAIPFHFKFLFLPFTTTFWSTQLINAQVTVSSSVSAYPTLAFAFHSSCPHPGAPFRQAFAVQGASVSVSKSYRQTDTSLSIVASPCASPLSVSFIYARPDIPRLSWTFSLHDLFPLSPQSFPSLRTRVASFAPSRWTSDSYARPPVTSSHPRPPPGLSDSRRQHQPSS